MFLLFFFKLYILYINSSKNLCVTCPSSVKKMFTERNETDNRTF